jgi:signal transduction histidine kinase
MPVLSLLIPATGDTLWIGTRSGLVAFHDGKTKHYGSEAGLKLPDVRSIVADDAGTIWFGMVGGGLASIREGVLRQFGKKDGLSSVYVQSLLFDENGALWIGTADGGLNRFKEGRFTVVGAKQGLPGNAIGHIVDDARGFLWMSSQQGIFRVAKEDLNRCADGETSSVSGQLFGAGEGLPSLEFTGGQNAGCRTADGRVWFSTDAGVVSIDPAVVTKNAIPPRTLIEEVRIEGQAMTSSGAITRIPAGTGRIEVHYTGLSFAAPEKVRFRHRLKGLEENWLEVGTEREITYNYLPPGRYQFEVVSCNNDGVWDSTPAVQELRVLPFFWQTWWFRGLGLLALLNGAAFTGRAVTRRRMKYRVEKAERQHAVERERSRIARDIHDDLGASLTRIALLSQSARADFDHPEQMAGDLAQIYGTAREVTRAMDEIVWAVNPKHDTLDSLATYLGKFAEDFLRSADLRCRLNIAIQLPPWHLTAEVRHNVFLAFKETLHNILKHAGATEVKIGLTVDVRMKTFALIIEDDGRGFDAQDRNAPAATTDRIANGHGLANLRTRLEEAGGRYEVETQPGKGTRTSLIVVLRRDTE